MQLIKGAQQHNKTVTFVFGNPYAIKNICDARNIVACYQDDAITQEAAADVLKGVIGSKGRLPVTVCPEFTYGSGISTDEIPGTNSTVADSNRQRFHVVDSLAKVAIEKHATPGIELMVVKDGRIMYHNAYGYYSYDSTEQVKLSTLYDLVSSPRFVQLRCRLCTCTTRVNLTWKNIGDYLPGCADQIKRNSQSRTFCCTRQA